MTKGKVDISQNKPSIACAMESIFHDYSSLPVGSCAMELDQGDDSVSWFDYQIVEPHPLQDDYPSDSDLPHGVSAVTANEQSSVSDLVLLDKKTTFDQITCNTHANYRCDSVSLQEGIILKRTSWGFSQ
ncbi:hypothetical protein Dimus_022784 [Dionaea muscipula]